MAKARHSNTVLFRFDQNLDPNTIIINKKQIQVYIRNARQTTVSIAEPPPMTISASNKLMIPKTLTSHNID
jgi:hypothetical protein